MRGRHVSASLGSDLVLVLSSKHHHGLGGRGLPRLLQAHGLCSQLEAGAGHPPEPQLPGLAAPGDLVPLAGGARARGQRPHDPPQPLPAPGLLPHADREAGAQDRVLLMPGHRWSAPSDLTGRQNSIAKKIVKK